MSKQSAHGLGVLFAIVVMVAASASIARADEQVVAHVPFAFIVGDSRLPAGDYSVRGVDHDPNLIQITSADHHQATFTLTMASPSIGMAAHPQLVFEKFDGQYFLARIDREDGNNRVIMLTPAIMEREVATAR